MLLDRSNGRFVTEFAPSKLHAMPDEPKHWLLDGWEALSNVVKYLRRGSFLEAAEQMHRARQRVFQLLNDGSNHSSTSSTPEIRISSTSRSLPSPDSSSFKPQGSKYQVRRQPFVKD
jgi:hypothetical protein